MSATLHRLADLIDPDRIDSSDFPEDIYWSEPIDHTHPCMAPGLSMFDIYRNRLVDMTEDIGVQDYEPLKDRCFLEKQADRFHAIILDSLGGKEIRLSAKTILPMEEESIRHRLNSSGFRVSDIDIDDLLLVAKAIRNERQGGKKRKNRPDIARPVSLNCYDYDRLKLEVEDLAEEIGYRELDRLCPTLIKILNEAILNDESEDGLIYGRQQEFPMSNDSVLLTYQRLVLIDKILFEYTMIEGPRGKGLCNYEILHQMRKEIERLNSTSSKKLNSEKLTNLSDDSLKHLFVTLENLISVEYWKGKNVKYDRSVYEFPIKGRRLYRMRKRGEPVKAFAVDISLEEVRALRTEIKKLKTSYFEDDADELSQRYRLIAAIGDLENMYVDDFGFGRAFHDVKRTDLKTVNYLSNLYFDLYRKAERAVKGGLPLVLRDNDSMTAYHPVRLTQTGTDWSLIGKSVTDGDYRILTPEILESSWITDGNSGKQESIRPDECPVLIGGGKTLAESPIQVTLGVTGKGMRKLEKEPFCLQIAKLFKTNSNRISSLDNFKKGDPDWTGHTISFQAFLTVGFLKELFQLDKCGELVSIQPTDLNRIYLDFYKETTGKDRIPLCDRPSHGRIKVVKNSKHLE